MESKIVKFVDVELGNSLWTISFDAQMHNFDDCFDLAKTVMYLPLEEGFDELKNEYPELTKEHYDIASEILEKGDCGVTDDRFCQFLTNAFGFVCNAINEDISFNIETGEFAF